MIKALPVQQEDSFTMLILTLITVNICATTRGSMFKGRNWMVHLMLEMRRAIPILRMYLLTHRLGVVVGKERFCYLNHMGRCTINLIPPLSPQLLLFLTLCMNSGWHPIIASTVTACRHTPRGLDSRLTQESGIWNRSIIALTAVCIVYNNNAQFHEYDKSFEHEWTILTHQLGLNTGYLASNYFEHIGEKVSAYVLNNYTRVWDQHRDALKDLGYLWTKTTLFE